jgi:hypothetical protein
MLRKKIISAVFGSAVLLATVAGTNAMPSGGALQQALLTGSGQTDVIKVHHKKKFKKFKKFHFYFGHYPAHFRCHWLKKKALYFGTDYWWDRYEKCIDYWDD